MSSSARKIEKTGSFVKLETNKEFEKFWKLVKNNFDSSKKEMINDFQKWKEINNVTRCASFMELPSFQSSMCFFLP